METASSQPGDLVLEREAAAPESELPAAAHPIPAGLLRDLAAQASLEAAALTPAEFGEHLQAVGARVNFGVVPPASPAEAQQTSFLRSLHLAELALAHACALGREPAWQHFLKLYRAPLTQAAIAIAGNATTGHELADSLYSELFGLTGRDGQRRSPLSSYSGRGSLLGWLRTTLAQRHVDRFRRSRRETPLDELTAATLVQPQTSAVPAPAQQLGPALSATLKTLPAEDRYLLAAYFLDRRTLLELSRILRVHEATVSRRLQRLLAAIRKQLLRTLVAGGLSQRAAQEALSTDPRDLEVNLRSILQVEQLSSFHEKDAQATG